MTVHMFTLYRLGDAEGTPWDDAQIWAKYETIVPPSNIQFSFCMNPFYGSSAALYRVNLDPGDEAEPGWMSRRAQLMVNSDWFDRLPLTWYVGAPTDWPSGIARYPEIYGPRNVGSRDPDSCYPRGVWALTVRRTA